VKLYSIKLRLAGSVANEVRKSDVTAAEIEVLRAIHGADAVSDIVETGEVKRDSAAERQRLYARYAGPQNNTAEQVAKKMTLMRNIFGHDSLPLPEAVGHDVPKVEPEVAATAAKERAPAFAE